MLHQKVIVVYLVLSAAFEEFPYTTVEDNFNDHYFMKNGTKIFNGPHGSVSYKKDKLVITCNDRYLLNRVIEPLKEAVTAKEVLIAECYLPERPLIEQFRELNINGTGIEMLVISVWHKDMLGPGNYTIGLRLKTLWIHTPLVRSRDFLMFNPNFLKPLTKLTNLILWGTKLPVLPEETRLEYLSLRHNVIVDTWESYCRDLKKLSIHDLRMEELPEEWPKNCSQLTAIRLKGLSTGTAQRILSNGMHNSCSNLQSLYIQSCNLTTLPFELLDRAKDLKHLNLSSNRLQDKDLANFPMFVNLTNLDLGSNLLTGWVIINLVKQVPALRYLNLDGNNYINFCNFETHLNKFSSHLKSLERFSLKGTSMNVHCLQNVTFSKLKYLDLGSSEKIMTLLWRKLPRSNASHLEVNLLNREIDEIYFNKYDYDLINLSLKTDSNSTFLTRERGHFTVLVDPIDCDCNHYWLARCIRDFPDFISFPGLSCKITGAKITEGPLDELNCRKYYQNGCIKREYGSLFHYKTYVDCHNGDEGNSKYPLLANAYSLNVSNNNVVTLQGIDISDTMQWIDLRRNRISYLDENDTARLFNNSQRQVWLSQNLYVCDCDRSSMIDTFHLHRKRIVDFDEIICFDSGKLLSSVSTFQVCQYGLRIGVAMSLITVILILAAILSFWRYRLTVRIYLYSKGWCLYCLSEEDTDSDRPYDAFLSFAHADEEYVVEKLLPILENKPYSYRMCVHFRDWVLGDWIPTQIMRSVRLSKRTLIVLSRKFVESMWGSLEFRYAVASAAQEGRSRLLVLVMDDVLSEELDAELQGYLSFNTYLRCDDPWFWEKLNYAMPRKKLLPGTHSHKRNSSEEIVMNSVLASFPNLRTTTLS